MKATKNMIAFTVDTTLDIVSELQELGPDFFEVGNILTETFTRGQCVEAEVIEDYGTTCSIQFANGDTAFNVNSNTFEEFNED